MNNDIIFFYLLLRRGGNFSTASEGTCTSVSPWSGCEMPQRFHLLPKKMVALERQERAVTFSGDTKTGGHYFWSPPSSLLAPVGILCTPPTHAAAENPLLKGSTADQLALRSIKKQVWKTPRQYVRDTQLLIPKWLSERQKTEVTSSRDESAGGYHFCNLILTCCWQSWREPFLVPPSHLLAW